MDAAELVEGLSLMLVGMLTVFSALFLVVLMGRLMIRILNRFTPDEVPAPTTGISRSGFSPSHLSPQQIAVLAAAVLVVTHGKGKIVSIAQTSSKPHTETR